MRRLPARVKITSQGGWREGYHLQKNVTRKGTDRSVRKPWRMEVKAQDGPLAATIAGKVESIVVAPPAWMGASGPKVRASQGAPRKVNSSRRRLLIKATVPKAEAD